MDSRDIVAELRRTYQRQLDAVGNADSILRIAAEEIERLLGPPALDVSLEHARALHRVWRALNDGDCPKCHRFHAATDIIRWPSRIICPSCNFSVMTSEIEEIEKLFAPAMDAAVSIFEKWRLDSRVTA